MKTLVCKCGCCVFTKQYKYMYDGRLFESDRTTEVELIVCVKCGMSYDPDLCWKFYDEIIKNGGSEA